MNRTIRGMAGLLVALGASACANDYSLDFEGPPTKIQASPTVMFITANAAPKELLLRLTNDINQSVPASFTVSNVPAGLTVAHDDNYRPDYVNPDGTLQQPDQLVQQRYFVSSNVTTGGLYTFTVTSGSLSQEITVRVLPIDLGAGLSVTAPALGDIVTIAAPSTMSFSNNSVVSFDPGGEAIITEQSATSISFIPRPGSEGPASVSNVVLNYAPTLSPRTLETAASITVPSVGDITGTFSNASPAAGATTTFTATGSFKFLPNVRVDFGGRAGAVVGLSADGKTMTILPPLGLSGATMTVTNSILSFLPQIVLDPRPTASGTVTTPGTITMSQLANTTDPVAGSPEMALGPTSPNGGIFDTGTWTGADALGGGGPNRWYHLVVTGDTYNRTFTVDWAASSADLDMYMTNEAISAFVGSTSASAGSSHPESQSVDIAAGSYWVIPVNWNHIADPAWIFLTVQ